MSSLSERIHQRSIGNNRVHDIMDDLIPRYNVNKELKEHSGCVNTVSFSDSGDLLISGSDDKYICIWDGYTFDLKDKIYTEHGHNIFSAVMLNDGIISCCAMGDVYHTNLNGQSAKLHNHGSEMAYQIEIIDRNSFMSCGEDGKIIGYDLRDRNNGIFTMVNSVDIFKKEKELSDVILKHKTIERGIPSISLKDDVHFAAAFNDDFVRIFDRRQLEEPLYSYCPAPINPFSNEDENSEIRTRLGSRVTSCQYDPKGSGNLAISYSDENVYVVNPDFEDFNSIQNPASQYYQSSNTVASLSGHLNRRTMIKECSFLGNNSEYVMSGSDDGRCYIWSIQSQKIVNCFEADEDVVNCVVSHPVIPCLVLSGIDHSIKVCFPENDPFDEQAFDEYLQERSVTRDSVDEYTLRMPLMQLLESKILN